MQERRHARYLNAIAPDSNQEVMWLLGRAYLNHVTVLKDHLRQEGLVGVKPGMGHVFFALFAQDNMPLVELSRCTGLAASSLTELVQRMERAGWVSRAKDANDKRMVRIRLTDASREIEPKLKQIERKMRGLTESGFTPEEAGQMRTALSRLIKNLNGYFIDPDNTSPSSNV